MSGVPYVDWAPVSTGVYVAKSASVLSVERCPLCKKAMETEPDIIGEVVCLGSHAFKVDDDGDSYSLTYTDAIRPKRASTSYERQDDGAYVASLNANSFSCPLTDCEAPIDPGSFGQKVASEMLFVYCSEGHEFQAYPRLPKVWLYEADAGPFDTQSKFAKVACAECGCGHLDQGQPCPMCEQRLESEAGYSDEELGFPDSSVEQDTDDGEFYPTRCRNCGTHFTQPDHSDRDEFDSHVCTDCGSLYE